MATRGIRCRGISSTSDYVCSVPLTKVKTLNAAIHYDILAQKFIYQIWTKTLHSLPTI